MREHDFIYGHPVHDETTDKVLVKMYVPKRLKRGLDSLKLTRGKNLQQLAAEAIEQYLARELHPEPAS
ncbi:MAG: hypothetical protein KY455_13225 [Euryarchaeota archaeon]|nr:hypothetical protein [Euryarchaeota archaeon]